jgi:tetratricopeptide (TPR) repeat protein
MLAQMAETLDDDRRRAYVAWRRSARAMRTADWATQEREARKGMAFAARAGDDGLRLHALRLLVSVLVQYGEIDAGRTLALQGLAEARNLQLRGVQGRLLNILSIAAELQDDLVASLDLRQQSLVVARETGDRINEAITQSNMGVGWLNLGDFALARRDLDAALQMLRANGDRTMESLTLCHLTTLALWEGDATRAQALARSALELAVAAQARDMEAVAWLRLGDAELGQGRLAAAREAYAQARALAREIDVPWQHDATACLAQVELAAQDPAAASAALQPVLDHVASGGALVGTENPRQIELTCHQVLARSGDPRAAAWLARAHAALTAQADAITDATWRRSFLLNIPWNREIESAFAKQASGSDTGG